MNFKFYAANKIKALTVALSACKVGLIVFFEICRLDGNFGKQTNEALVEINTLCRSQLELFDALSVQILKA